jgi:hypothetical protein
MVPLGRARELERERVGRVAVQRVAVQPWSPSVSFQQSGLNGQRHTGSLQWQGASAVPGIRVICVVGLTGSA